MSAQTRQFDFQDHHFATIRDLAYNRTGINLLDSKRELVYSRLSRRLRKLGFSTFDQYCALLAREGNDEMGEFTNALTTNLTYFFREEHHFDYLQKTVLPELMQRHRDDRRLRLWSAGCSTGEEPYTLAMVFREVVAPMSNWNARILATDLDSNVIAKGKAGKYKIESLERVSDQRTKRWFRPGSHPGEVAVNPELREIITFKELNLFHKWPMKGLFDIIFCRNVVIYFDKPTQRGLFDRFADVIAPKGWLFVGHSENLFKVSDRFELIGKSVYQKKY